MIIYTDQKTGLFGGIEMTPAHVYAATTDFSVILDDIASGKLPCNTGKPFPVVWKTESDDNTPQFNTSSIPNSNNYRNNNPYFDNPWVNNL